MTKYIIKYTSQFKKDIKLAEKQGLPISELKSVVRLIADGDILPQKYHDHPHAYRHYNPYIIRFENDDEKPTGTKATQFSLFGIIPSVSFTLKY